jgi:hypothetical protein
VIDEADRRGARDVEIAYAVVTSALPALVLYVAVVGAGAWSGLDGTAAWPAGLRLVKVLLAVGAVARVVYVLVRFDAGRRPS